MVAEGGFEPTDHGVKDHRLNRLATPLYIMMV